MFVTLIQPLFSMNYEDADACFSKLISIMHGLDDRSDLIVLPEYCDIPANTPGKDEFHLLIGKYNPVIRKEAAELAKRCHAFVFANYAEKSSLGYRNATHVLDRGGREIGIYYKAHPAPSEFRTKKQGGNELDCSYSYHYSAPYIVELEGIRVGFITCYDVYMYEGFSRLARENIDIVIGCSRQKNDTHQTIDILSRFLAYNTNAYLLRSSVSRGDGSEVCGSSMVVAPDGNILLNMWNQVGAASVEIDPHNKYDSSAGRAGSGKPHWMVIEESRRPWLYRPAGSMMVPGEREMPYPRVCARHGFHAGVPENSLPAFGAAVALGADEIEFDVWATKDGQLVSVSDPFLPGISTGSGYVWDHTLTELQKFDFGIRSGIRFEGLRILRFEDILKKFACTCIMNIHMRIWDIPGMDPHYQEIADLLYQYGCERHCYLTSGSERALSEFHEIAPVIDLCVAWDRDKGSIFQMIDHAEKAGAKKVQFASPFADQKIVVYAHENGIRCNVLFTDGPGDAQLCSETGIDGILTNDCLSMLNAMHKNSMEEV